MKNIKISAFTFLVVSMMMLSACGVDAEEDSFELPSSETPSSVVTPTSSVSPNTETSAAKPRP